MTDKRHKTQTLAAGRIAIRHCVGLIAMCALVCLTAAPASAKCTSADEREITEVRDSWKANWNANKLEDVMKLYATDATYLPSDGGRVSGQDAIKAYFGKLIVSSKVSSIVSVTLDCSGDVAYDSGTYTQDVAGGGVAITPGVTMTPGVTISPGGGKHVEGNYLVVLKREGRNWLIVQHASTAKP